ACEELLPHPLTLRRLRLSIRAEAAPALTGDGGLRAELVSRLSFALTSAQKRVVGEIERDLAGTTPMLRLGQGDVGSGKTVGAGGAAEAPDGGWRRWPSVSRPRGDISARSGRRPSCSRSSTSRASTRGWIRSDCASRA